MTTGRLQGARVELPLAPVFILRICGAVATRAVCPCDEPNFGASETFQVRNERGVSRHQFRVCRPMIQVTIVSQLHVCIW